MPSSNSNGYAFYHDMDYAGRSFQRGEYSTLEFGLHSNDKSLLNIGYLVEHDGKKLESCLRCSRKFVRDDFLRRHEETCPMVAVELEPSEPNIVMDVIDKEPELEPATID